MKITNRYNIPTIITKIVEDDIRILEPNKYSVTELLKPIKEIVLYRKYHDVITADISEFIPAVFGTAFHTLMEKYDTGDLEHRIEYPVSNSTLSGKYDKLDNFILYDYKTTSVWKYQNGDFKDYKRQGLMYAWLLRKNGLYVEKCVFYMFLKDHSLSRGRFTDNYPPTAFGTYEFNVTPLDLLEIEKYITDRIKLIESYIDTPDNMLPMPTHEESWYTGDKYAVMKNGSDRAVKVCDTMEEADANLYRGNYIEVRKGEHLKSYFSEFFRNYVMYDEKEK